MTPDEPLVTPIPDEVELARFVHDWADAIVANDVSTVPFFIGNALKDIDYYRTMAGTSGASKAIADGVAGARAVADAEPGPVRDDGQDQAGALRHLGHRLGCRGAPRDDRPLRLAAALGTRFGQRVAVQGHAPGATVDVAHLGHESVVVLAPAQGRRRHLVVDRAQHVELVEQPLPAGNDEALRTISPSDSQPSGTGPLSSAQGRPPLLGA